MARATPWRSRLEDMGEGQAARLRARGTAEDAARARGEREAAEARRTRRISPPTAADIEDDAVSQPRARACALC